MSGGGPLVPRRHWLIAVARYLTLGGVGLLVWNIVSRSGRVCLRVTSPCHECQLLAHCQLPKAQEERVEAGTNS
jgi:hypothetical protein